jgi:ribonuclease HI
MYSPNDRDEIFSSLGSTDALQWRGVSIGMPPSPADRVKAVKHAGYSSMQADLAQASVITLLLLPVNANHREGFATHLTRLGNRVTRVAQLPPGLPCSSAGFWYATPEPDAKSRLHLQLIAIHNERNHASSLRALRLEILRLVPHARVPNHVDITPGANQAPPPKFRLKPISPGPPPCPGSQDLAPAHILSDQEVTPLFPKLGSELTYTDGSCRLINKRQVTGAGVFAPHAQEAQELHVHPGGVGVTNTINRAELAGILVALAQGHNRIATDSLASIYQIKKAVHAPMQIRTHLHQSLLTRIVEKIAAAQEPVHLIKVKAHDGVIGNERADALAQQAAALGETCPIGLSSTPNPFEDRVWLHDNGEEGEPRILANPTSEVRRIMTSRHRMGRSNQQSIYYQSAQRVAAEAASGTCAHIMTDSTIQHKQRRTILQYRFGVLYNKKWAVRFKKAHCSNCDACGKPDSGTHRLAGPCCDAHAKQVALRHHEATRLIARALAKGSRGGEICFVDVKAACDDPDLQACTLQRWPRLLRELQNAGDTSSRPDIVMRNIATGKITLIEIKYCADHQVGDQLQRAQEQHTRLVDLVRQRHPKDEVQLLPILLGHGGTIYTKHTREPLLSLMGDVSHLARVKKLEGKLIRNAAKHAELLVRTHYAASTLRGGVT